MAINSEWELIDTINALLQPDTPDDPRLIKGIGDDCAVYTIDKDRYGLFTTDICIENIHFDNVYTAPRDTGHKAMAANLSDIAAMGGRPHLALVSLGVPHYCDDDRVMELYRGFQDVARPFNVRIAGGDISRSEQLVVNIAVYGEVDKSGVIMRCGAGPGDGIYVTGDLGGSLAGFKVLTGHPERKDNFPGLTGKHLRPVPRLDVIDDIKTVFSPGSMIDISDGLLSDLHHLCRQSNTGFKIEYENIPIPGELLHFADIFNYDAVSLALKSGEEYQLLFTAPVDIERDSKNRHLAKKIGQMTESGFLLERNGTTTKLTVKGYDHFK